MVDTSTVPAPAHHWTKEEIATLVSPEQVMVALGLPALDEDLGGRFHSPFRDDQHPDCKLFYGKENGKLHFYDPSMGLTLDWLGAVQYARNCTFPRALDFIADLFSLEPGQAPTAEAKHYQQLALERAKTKRYPTTIAVRAVSMSRRDLEWWAQFNIDADMLFRNRVWAISDYWLDGRHSYVSKDTLAFAYKEEDGYKLYFPEAERRGKWLSSTKTLSCYENLPQTGELLVITSSKKDALCLASFGYCAVAPQGEGMDLPPHMLWELKQRFKRVVIFYDNDYPGLIAGHQKSIAWQVHDFVYIPLHEEAKDPAAYCAQFGPTAAASLFTTILSCTLA